MTDKNLDLNAEIVDLIADDAELVDLLGELGLADVDRTLTIPAACESLGIDVGIVGFALEASGYDVSGFVAPEREPHPLPEMIQFLVSDPGRPSPDRPSAIERHLRANPMVEHMEAAVRAAQERGDLSS